MHTFERTRRLSALSTLSFMGIAALLSWTIASHRMTAAPVGQFDRADYEILLAHGAGVQGRADMDARHYVFLKILEGERIAVHSLPREHVRRTRNRDAVRDPGVWQDACILALANIGAASINPDNDQELALVISFAARVARGPMLHQVATWYVFNSAGSFERRLRVANSWIMSLQQFVPLRLDNPPAYHPYVPGEGTFEDAILAMYSKVIGGYERGLGGDAVLEGLRDVWARYYDTLEGRDDLPDSETKLVNAQFAFLDRQVRMNWGMW